MLGEGVCVSGLVRGEFGPGSALFAREQLLGLVCKNDVTALPDMWIDGVFDCAQRRHPAQHLVDTWFVYLLRPTSF